MHTTTYPKKGVKILLFAYMKKLSWVILTLLLAAVIIIAIVLLSPSAPTQQEFNGTFIMK